LIETILYHLVNINLLLKSNTT